MWFCVAIVRVCFVVRIVPAILVRIGGRLFAMGILVFRIFFFVSWGLPFYESASRLISFFFTPSAFPDLPVVLVRWPLTRSP